MFIHIIFLVVLISAITEQKPQDLTFNAENEDDEVRKLSANAKQGRFT